ncbi:MAG TPA: methyltransferase domain-containing protein [Candidatus Polarisedimenticolaceae bacterium]|nr:methyltransferase domain-containing protein [Candidatus Polarisedimenticolaceae bacterium]
MNENARFSGSVPGYYDQYLGPFLFDAYSDALVARLPSREGLRVLEIACGSGRVTERLVKALPRGGTLVATDLNQAMIDLARERVKDAGITWRTADAAALPFEDASFDAVVCGFGLMFVPDKTKAMSEARRVLVQGGTLLATVWGFLPDNPAIHAMHEKLLAMFPENPPRFLETPYGFGDPAFWKDAAAGSAFTYVTVDRIHHAGTAPSSEHVATGFVKGTPLFPALAERGADHDRVIREMVLVLGSERPFRTPLSGLLLEAS